MLELSRDLSCHLCTSVTTPSPISQYQVAFKRMEHYLSHIITRDQLRDVCVLGCSPRFGTGAESSFLYLTEVLFPTPSKQPPRLPRKDSHLDHSLACVNARRSVSYGSSVTVPHYLGIAWTWTTPGLLLLSETYLAYRELLFRPCVSACLASIKRAELCSWITACRTSRYAQRMVDDLTRGSAAAMR